MPNILCDPARYRVRAAALGIAIFSAFLWSMPAGALAPEILRAGDIHTIVPPDTECSTITGKSHSSVGVDADCNAANGNAYVLAEFGSTFAGDGSGFAVARFSYFFVVEEVPGISEQSLVPIRLNVPIDWVYRLRNNDTTGLFNESSGNITIRLWGTLSAPLTAGVRK